MCIKPLFAETHRHCLLNTAFGRLSKPLRLCSGEGGVSYSRGILQRVLQQVPILQEPHNVWSYCCNFQIVFLCFFANSLNFPVVLALVRQILNITLWNPAHSYVFCVFNWSQKQVDAELK